MEQGLGWINSFTTGIAEHTTTNGLQKDLDRKIYKMEDNMVIFESLFGYEVGID